MFSDFDSHGLSGMIASDVHDVQDIQMFFLSITIFFPVRLWSKIIFTHEPKTLYNGICVLKRVSPKENRGLIREDTARTLKRFET